MSYAYVFRCVTSYSLMDNKREWGTMRKIITSFAGAVLTLGLAACAPGETTEPATNSSEVTTTTSKKTTVTTTVMNSEKTAASSESAAQPDVEEAVAEAPAVQEPYTEPVPEPVVADTHVVPERPVFMRPEDWDPYGPPRFVQCWENETAVMTDGSLVRDTVNCGLERDALWSGFDDLPPRTDGCVGPAAECGYYDEQGNPIWFDKQTGETSPRYYDEYGNPTMESPY